MQLSCEIPTTDSADFGRLNQDTRIEVRRRLRAVEMLLKIHAEGGENFGAAVKRIGGGIGVAYATMRRYFDNFRHSGGDWRTLVDKKCEPELWRDGRPSVPAWVTQLWKKLCEENNRKMEPAHRALVRLWQAGYLPPEAPAGAQWPAYEPRTGLPVGCSLGNLRQKYRPTNFELDAMRNGLGSALGKYGPKVITTRAGLWVGSHYIIDDVKRDMEFLLLGHGGQRVVPLELGVQDLFSADRFAVHRRPQFKRADGTTDKLKERETRFVLGSVFRNMGYSPRGTQIIAELGTAAVRQRLKDFLHLHSGGKITVREPGIVGREQAIAGYYGVGGGNPRHKRIESHHNLLQNEAGALLAQVGHDRNPPEWLHGLQCMTDQVLKWMMEAPPEKAALFRTMHCEWWQGCALLNEIDERIAWRTDHDLEGWVTCGHTLAEYCVDLIADKWIGPEEFCTLPVIAQQRIEHAARVNRDMVRARKLAPREVLSKGMGELVKFPDVVLALMFCDRELGDDLRLPKPKRLTADGVLEVQDTIVSPEFMTFGRELAAPEGGTFRLQDRTDYTVAVNPYDLDRLWVYDLSARFLGTSAIRRRASQLPDRAYEITTALGIREHEKAQLTAPLAERHAGAAQLIADIQEHNAAVRAGAKQDTQRENFGQAARSAERRPGRSRGATDADLDDIAGDAVRDVPHGVPASDGSDADAVFEL